MSGSFISRASIVGKAVTRVSSHGDRRPWLLPKHGRHCQSALNYATLGKLEGTPTTSSRPRKSVTVSNDDGRVPWDDLSRGEKVARTTQQSFNFGIVLAGAAGTALVVFFLYQEVFSTDSKTRHFNQAVDQIRGDPRVLELLGSRQKIRAYGEPSASKWSRNRPLASSVKIDRNGIEHLRMHFNVTGSERSGVVQMHMIKRPGDSGYRYQYLALDVSGHPRLYLENAAENVQQKKTGFRMLGVQWK